MAGLYGLADRDDRAWPNVETHTLETEELRLELAGGGTLPHGLGYAVLGVA